MRSNVFKASYWNYVEEQNHLDIHIGGLTQEKKTVHIIVENFQPAVYVELPMTVSWHPGACRRLFEYIKQIMKPVQLLPYEECARLCQKQKLHYQEKCLCLRVELPTYSAGRRLAWLCRKNFTVYGLGHFPMNAFRVHEHNIDPLIKFTSQQNLPLAGWIRVVETIPEGEENELPEARKYSSADIDMFCDWESVEPAEFKNADPPPQIMPTFFSFDIECYSENPNSKLPDGTMTANVVFQIACVLGRFGEPEASFDKVLFSLHDPAPIEGTHIRRCLTEGQLLLAFAAFITERDPDVFVGYNIYGFDWPYLLQRATVAGVSREFSQIGRLYGVAAPTKQVKWSSGAYGEQEFNFPDAQGRINVDVMKEIQREYRLASYRLNAVAAVFLKQSKDDVTPRQIFMLYEAGAQLPALCAGAEKAFRREVRRILVKRFTHGEVKELRRSLLKAGTVEERKRLVREALRIVGQYCVQDTVLPVRLCERLNLWTTMEALSNCMSVPLSYLHSRGQQIKVLAQVYREIITRNFIVPFFSKDQADGRAEERYQGATVIDAHEGHYENVALLDFLSLYPTLIIAFNICYTAIVQDGDPISDDRCHVLEWEDHVGCSHDPKKRKKKANEILCQKKRYRFRRVQTGPEGRREGEGIIPALERRLLTERGKIKQRLKQAKLEQRSGNTDPALDVRINILDANQKALKVSANSAYGAMGARTGFMPLLAGAASVTAMGRKLIGMAIDHIKARYPSSRLVYGDSVSSDTPLLIKYVGGTKDGLIDITTIEVLFENTNGTQKPYDQFQPFDPDGERIHKEKTEFDGERKFQVWSWGELEDSASVERNVRRTFRAELGGKWANITKVIRHKTNKKMYRVNTHPGCVDVTEDHSLLRPNGDTIKPSELKVGEQLLHSFPVFTGKNDSFHDFKTNAPSGARNVLRTVLVSRTVEEKKAFVYGFFYGHGSCGKYVCKSGWSWALNHQDLTAEPRVVPTLLAYLEEVYLDDFEYTRDTFQIVPCGGHIKKYVLEYRCQFYDKDSLKKVPRCMLNGDVNIRKAFMSGYYTADDGYKEYFSNQGKIGSQGLYYMCKSLGYSCSVQIRKENMNIYRVNLEEAAPRSGAVQKIIELPSVTQDTFVYDIETDEGNFQCGVGEIVVKNTDSCMIRFDGASIEESFRLAHAAAATATHCIKSFVLGIPSDYTTLQQTLLCDVGVHTDELSPQDRQYKLEYDSIPIELEFEDMFGRYLLLTQKRYAGYVIDAQGRKGKIVKKGIVLARRDNCAFLKKVYGSMLDSILDGRKKAPVLQFLFAEVEKMYTRQIRSDNFVIYLGVNSLLSYAKTDAAGRYLDEYDEPVENPPVEDPLDPRLCYPHLRQVMLALRMLKRGTSVPAGSRLEFVFVVRPDAQFEGDRLEDFDFFLESLRESNRLRIDYHHYLEKQIMKPVTELLSVAFPSKKQVPLVPYAELLEDDVFGSLGEYQACLVSRRSGLFAKARHVVRSARRWDFLQLHGACPAHLVYRGSKTCQCVLIYGGGNRNDIQRTKHLRVVSLCEKFVAFDIVARLRVKAGLRRVRKRRGLPRGSTEYPKDSQLVADLLNARRNFATVVHELNITNLNNFLQ